MKEQIQSALKAFDFGSLADNAKSLLNTLGYDSERSIQLSPNNYKGFSEFFNVVPGNFDPEKAKVKDWQSIDIIFQLTEDDIKKSHSLFETKKVDNTIIESYLFFVLSLTGDKYTRGDLVKITREINRLTPMPAMILFRYNDYLTIAVIDRRLHKRESTKDVLEKVTLIKDINITKPHRAHVEILNDLSFDELQDKHRFTNFVELHNVWRKTLDTSELNKTFFRELANWYFWALKNVEFPDDAEKNKDVRNAIRVIRMITRLIFIWFVKEKGLVPEDLFNQTKLKSLLNFTDKNQSTYYKAILQNLFFATLNTEMNKDKPGNRKFRGKNKGDGRDQHYMIHNVFRYEDYFVDPQDTLKKYFENVPFLNGGLFECLDKDISPTLEKGGERGFSNKKVVRIDGFSDHPKNSLKVPDHLFFSPEQSVDLNEIYGTKNKTYKVRGLIDILDSYKFTVDENTPIEEEIALDPELLGKVFENLLASYNPETQTTARKQTGSFYTPREIVNYMVDESIIAYLSTKLVAKFPAIGKDDKKLDERLRHLVAYNDQSHEFTQDEVDILIAAINTLKALDPACGSGAFPMGMLHKLVYILGKLDPDNSKWRELQRQKAIKETEEAYNIGDKEEREKRLLDISDVFENNSSDYGRKLYLIENCIFGVDIQPIAVQIAKLRFFVSLIVDQRIDPKKENLGVRPLPNLETKFVAANTLIGIEKPAQMLLRNSEIDRKEKELKEVRERHFTARTPQTKEKYRKADEKLRTEISELLKSDGFPRETTEKLAKWNPYDQNASADFFDSEWMFGIKTNSPLEKGDTGGCEGFDIVIGNPPYVRQEAIKSHKATFAKEFGAFYCGTADLYTYFYKKGVDVLKQGGRLCYIAPNKFMRAGYGKNSRVFLTTQATPKIVLDFGDLPIFEATTYPSILLVEKSAFVGAQFIAPGRNVTTENQTAMKQGVMNVAPTEFLAATFSDPDQLSRLNETIAEVGFTMPVSALSADGWSLERPDVHALMTKLRNAGKPLGEYVQGLFYRGITTGLNEAFVIDRITKDKLVAEDPESIDVIKPWLRGRDIRKWKAEWAGLYFLYIPWHFDIQKYPAILKHLKQFKSQLENRNIEEKDRYEWYALQRYAADYHQAFEKPKIMWRHFTTTPEFIYDKEGHYSNDKSYILQTNDLSLLGILNSSVTNFFIRQLSPPVRGGFLEMRTIYMEQFPLPALSVGKKAPIIKLVETILAAKKQQPPSSPFAKGELKDADTSALEKQIDEMVYALYGLTPEEIAIVEGKK